MADETPTQRKFQRKDWKTAAEFIKDEKERRAGSSTRRELDRHWKEVDRQVAMRPKSSKTEGGKPEDWMPDFELPLQATALEVLTADARRLKFPSSSEWYRAHAELSDDYAERYQDRRSDHGLIAKETGGKLDQETADLLAKAAIDHYHRLYRFREQIDRLDIEAFKYGTYAARVVEGLVPKFTRDYRGVRQERTLGPAVVPVSIKNLFLDESPQYVMHEGVAIAPLTIRNYFQRKDDLLKAAKTGGVDKGWIAPNIRRLEPMGDGDEKRGHVELLEAEGDLVIGRSGGKIFLPNVVVTVAVGNNGPAVVRYRESKLPFRSYVIGTYHQERLDCPYGTSPLMKGQPIQEAATEAANRLVASACLAAEPPLGWDSTDVRLKARGGPVWFPGAQWEMDDPNAIKVFDEAGGQIEPLLNLYLALLKQYEDLTGVTAPRRGAQTKSHTTAYAVDVEAARGMTRTQDFVVTQEQGPLTSILYMEYEIIKRSLRSPAPILVDGSGLEGFVNLHADDLADNVVFDVLGSAGPASKREKAQQLIAAFQLMTQVAPVAMQMGAPVPNFGEFYREILSEVGDVANPERFITSPKGLPNAADGLGGVPGPGGVLSGAQLNQINALAAGQDQNLA